MLTTNFFLDGHGSLTMQLSQWPSNPISAKPMGTPRLLDSKNISRELQEQEQGYVPNLHCPWVQLAFNTFLTVGTQEQFTCGKSIGSDTAESKFFFL
jgi:hypothetical protein